MAGTRFHLRDTYRCATSDPCILSWPLGITARGEVRTQLAHVIDIVPTVLDPTVLDALGLEALARIRG